MYALFHSFFFSDYLQSWLIYDKLFPQLLREFNHVNPQDDEEGKEFLNTRVRSFFWVFF